MTLRFYGFTNGLACPWHPKHSLTWEVFQFLTLFHFFTKKHNWHNPKMAVLTKCYEDFEKSFSRFFSSLFFLYSHPIRPFCPWQVHYDGTSIEQNLLQPLNRTTMNIGQKLSKNDEKIHFFYDLGRGPGQRPSTGVFIYANPKNQEQKHFNKEALKILKTKKSQLIIEQQVIGIGTSIIPAQKYKQNFLDYFEEYIKLNGRDGNRHLPCCLSKLKLFIERDFLATVDITENFCKRFRRYLPDELTGETPANYFARFKWVIDAATKDGYFRVNPTDDIPAVGNPSIALKENLEVEECIALLNTLCFNQEVKDAFLFSCYTGLRWIHAAGIEKHIAWSCARLSFSILLKDIDPRTKWRL